MEFLRNLPTDDPAALAGLIDIRPARVVSMALTRSEHCQMTLLAFGDGESVSEERYFGDTLYLCAGGEHAPAHGERGEDPDRGPVPGGARRGVPRRRRRRIL